MKKRFISAFVIATALLSISVIISWANVPLNLSSDIYERTFSNQYAGNIVTDFYNQKCSGKSSCTKCFKDYKYPYEPYYYCLTYNSSQKNKLTGKRKCNIKGLNCSSVTEPFEFNEKGQVIYYSRPYSENAGGDLWEKIYFNYDNLGRLSKIEANVRSSIALLDEKKEKINYTYNGNIQTENRDYSHTDIPIISTDKYKTQNQKECGEYSCKYNDKFMPSRIIPYYVSYSPQLGIFVHDYNYYGLSVTQKYNCDNKYQNCKNMNIIEYDSNGNKTRTKENCDIYGNNCSENCPNKVILKDRYGNKMVGTISQNESCTYNFNSYNSKGYEIESRTRCNIKGEKGFHYSENIYNATGKKIGYKIGNPPCKDIYNEYSPSGQRSKTKILYYNEDGTGKKSSITYYLDNKDNERSVEKSDCDENFTNCERCFVYKKNKDVKCEISKVVNGVTYYK